MALTQAELNRRRYFITASEVAGLFGIGYLTASDVYFLKTEGIEPTTNPAIEAGNLLEPAVIHWAEGILGPIRKGDWVVHPNGIIGATLDGTTQDGTPVEAKSSCIVFFGSKEMREDWGEEYTDSIPAHYFVQVQTQLLVTRKPKAFVPALIGGRGFVMYEVLADEVVQQTILERCERFWIDNVQARVQPNDAPGLETMKRIRRRDGKRAIVPADLVDNYVTINDAFNQMKKDRDKAQASLLAKLGDAEIGVYEKDGVTREFTYFEQCRKGYVVEATKFRTVRMLK